MVKKPQKMASRAEMAVLWALVTAAAIVTLWGIGVIAPSHRTPAEQRGIDWINNYRLEHTAVP